MYNELTLQYFIKLRDQDEMLCYFDFSVGFSSHSDHLKLTFMVVQQWEQ